MCQLERGRTRPGEFHEEPVTDGLAARLPQQVLFPGQAGNRDRVPAQLRRHDPQSLAERHGRALCQPRHPRDPGHATTLRHRAAAAKRRLPARPRAGAPAGRERARATGALFWRGQANGVLQSGRQPGRLRASCFVIFLRGRVGSRGPLMQQCTQ